MKKQKPTELKSLEALGEGDVTRALQATFTVRKWKKPDLTGLADDVDKLTSEMTHMETEIASAVASLVETKEKIAHFQGNETAREIAEALAEKSIAETEAYIREQLGCQMLIGNDPIPRRTAMLAYLNTVLSVDFHGDSEKAFAAQQDLQDRGILVLDKSSQGPIVIGIQHYVVPETWGLKPRHLEKIAESVAQFSRNYMALRQEHRVEATRLMEDEAEIDLDMAQEGGTGKCLVRVRAEPMVDSQGNERVDSVTKRPLYHPGGSLLVEFGAKYVGPIRASGGIERKVTEMVSEDVSIPISALGDRKKLRLDKKVSETQFGLAWRFWKMMLNGIDGHQAAKAQEAIKLVMSQKGEITAQQMLGVNGSTGQCVKNMPAFLEFRGAFKFKRDGVRIYNPFLLGRVVEDNGKDFIEIVEVPPQLDTVLGKFVGKKFSVDDNFGHCPFGHLIRAIKGQYTQDHEVDLAKDGAGENGDGAEAPEEAQVAAE